MTDAERIDKVIEAIIKVKCTMIPKNIPVSQEDIAAFIHAFPTLPGTPTEAPRFSMIMGNPLITYGSGYLVYTGCEYCRSVNFPIRPYDYWICPTCGAPVCAG